jgi:hypothetical protein
MEIANAFVVECTAYYRRFSKGCMMGWLRGRGSEGSTWASIAVLLGMASTIFPRYALALQAVATAAAGAGMTIKDAGAKDATEK